uniref:Uncharacterized protein n=1 Tax=Arundo donax TaxID=35708 RepID=A0A0A9GJN0_ARUDO
MSVLYFDPLYEVPDRTLIHFQPVICTASLGFIELPLCAMCIASLGDLNISEVCSHD